MLAESRTLIRTQRELDLLLCINILMSTCYTFTFMKVSQYAYQRNGKTRFYVNTIQDTDNMET